MDKKELHTLWEDVREWLTDATRTAVREAEDLTRRGRLKVEIMNLSHRIEKKMTELGGRVYDRMVKAPDAPVIVETEMRRLFDEIAQLENERSRKRAEFEAEKQKRN